MTPAIALEACLSALYARETKRDLTKSEFEFTAPSKALGKNQL